MPRWVKKRKFKFFGASGSRRILSRHLAAAKRNFFPSPTKSLDIVAPPVQFPDGVAPEETEEVQKIKVSYTSRYQNNPFGFEFYSIFWEFWYAIPYTLSVVCGI